MGCVVGCGMTSVEIIAPEESVALDVAGSGFAHGYGVFETIKLQAGRLCFWSAHWERLTASAVALGLACSCDADTVLAKVGELCRQAGAVDGVVKLSLLRAGSGGRLLVYLRPGGAFPEVVDLSFSREFPLNESSVVAGHKTHNYLENIVLLERVRAEGFYDLVRTNTAGALAETTLGNVFCVVDGRLCTPSLACGVLPGVVRAAVLDVARALEVRADEDVYADSLLADADAVFVTNSLVGILPVGSIEGVGRKYTYASETNWMVQQLQGALAKAELGSSVLL